MHRAQKYYSQKCKTPRQKRNKNQDPEETMKTADLESPPKEAGKERFIPPIGLERPEEGIRLRQGTGILLVLLLFPCSLLPKGVMVVVVVVRTALLVLLI